MSNLNELLGKLNDDPVDVEVTDEMPKEREKYTPPPQPTKGKDKLFFQLPVSLDAAWQVFDTNAQGQRVALQFNDDAPLLTYPDGVPVRARLTNQTREVNGVKVSELSYLLAALGFRGPLKTNKDFIAAMSQYGGQYFQAGVDWTAYCNDTKPIYMAGQGKIEGSTGCGYNYATNAYKKKDGTPVHAIPRDDNQLFRAGFECLNEKCPATINVQVRLRNFAPAPTETEE